jgi:hypothetical protein
MVPPIITTATGINVYESACRRTALEDISPNYETATPDLSDAMYVRLAQTPNQTQSSNTAKMKTT